MSWIQGRGGFVGQEQLRPLHQRPADADPLTLSARQGVGALGRELGQPEPLQQIERLADIVLRELPQPGAPGVNVPQPAAQEVLDHAQPFDQVELLEDHPDPAAAGPQRLPAERDQIGAFEEDAARGRFHQPVDAAEQRALSRARGTDHDGDALGRQRPGTPPEHRPVRGVASSAPGSAAGVPGTAHLQRGSAAGASHGELNVAAHLSVFSVSWVNCSPADSATWRTISQSFL